MSATADLAPGKGMALMDPLQRALALDCGLSDSDLMAIDKAQTQDALDFSAAAIKLNLVTAEDLERARTAVTQRQPVRRGLLRRRPAPMAPTRPSTDRKNDQLRGLRTELLLRHDRRSCAANVIAVLSPAAGEGRSQMAADLAQSFARTGQPTLLVDADLRRPSQHIRFGLNNSPGLVEAIIDERAPAFQPVDTAGLLFLLPAGGPSDEAAELLSSQSFEVLLNSWAQQFDHIILDSPPAGEFPDALALGTIVGRVLLVNRAQCTSLNANREMLRQLEATRAEILGAVICHF